MVSGFTGMSRTKGFTIWFTGLPCSGKTTISTALKKSLAKQGLPVEILDGDVIRKGLSKDLGFSKEDRESNIERAAFVASLLSRNGVATLVSFVSPYRQSRDNARKLIHSFVEVYLKCPLEICEQRDVKGMYRLARRGEIKNFTGISDPYEEPLQPEITLDTNCLNITDCVKNILEYLQLHQIILAAPFDGPMSRSERT